MIIWSGGGGGAHGKLEKLAVPLLKTSSLVGGGQLALIVGDLVTQEHVECLLEEVHLEILAHFDALNDGVLTEVGGANDARPLVQQRYLTIVAPAQPE